MLMDILVEDIGSFGPRERCRWAAEGGGAKKGTAYGMCKAAQPTESQFTGAQPQADRLRAHFLSDHPRILR